MQEHGEHLDSPFLCAQAAVRALNHYQGDLPVWHSETWSSWVAVRDTVEHETEAVWVDDYLAIDAAKWAKEHNGIVWYSHDAFGQRVDLYNDEAVKAQWVNWGSNPDMNMIRNFVEGVAAHKPPTRCATGLDGLRATEVTAAAYKSAKTQKMVKI